MIRSRWIAACLTLAVLAIPASALDPGRRLTQYFQRIWQGRQGLPQAGIFAIRQTKDGYLWIGTADGLVRFDGVRFTPPGDFGGVALPNMSVRQLAEDARGDLWVGTSGAGLFRIDRRPASGFSVAHFSMRDGLPSDNVTCLFAGRRDDLWACTDHGLARIADGRIQKIGEAQLNITAAAQMADGSVWMGGDSPLLTVWNGTAISHFEIHTLPPYARVEAMLAGSLGGSDDVLWIGTTAGLIRLKNGREKRFTKADGLANDSVLALDESRDGSIWVGTDGGFSRWRNGELESFLPKNGLSQSTVAAVYEDREGSLWVGTKRGLNQFVDRRTLPLTTSEGLPSNDTGPVYQDARGVIWVGTLGAGLARFEHRQSSVLTKHDGLASNSILSLAGDGKGTLWVGTDAGLDRIRDGKISPVLPGVIRSLCPASNGDLWIGTSKGPAVLRAGRIVRLQPSAAVASLIETRGQILAAVEGVGIRAYNERTLRELSRPALAIRDADTLFRDGEGLVWIGGVGSGLHLLDGGRQVDFQMSDGLFDDEIYGVAADDRGALWFASSTGIFSVNRRELLEFAAGRIHHVTSTPFSPLDGLQTVECKPGVQPAAWRMRDGGLSFSTVHGLIAIHSDRLALKMDPPPVVIEDVAIDGRSQMASDQAAPRELSPGDQNLEFRYTALSLRAPQRITFRYKLEGFDRDWVDAGTRRQAFYTNLRPGDYRFRVSACNADGTCNQAGASFAFVLPGRFYQQTWFYLVCALSLAGLARLGYVFRIRHMERQFGAILAERSRIARELHDTLLQGFSGVTMEMQALAARMPAGTREALRDIIHDAANCLTEARRSVSELRRIPAASPGLAAELAENARQLTASSPARLKLNIEKRRLELPAYVEYNLLRIAQEAILNAVKHSGARNIEVILQILPERLRMVVADDGSGFAPRETTPDHFGLVGMKERAQEMGAELRVTSQYGAGTSVTLEIPIGRAGAAVSSAAAREVKAEI